MINNDAKTYIEQMFQALFASDATAADVSRYITDDFVQVADEHVRDRLAFDAHLEALRADVSDVSFEFTTVFAEGDQICDIHTARGTGKDGEPFALKLIATYTLRDGKVARIEEMSCLLNGAEEDRDLAYRLH